MSFSGPCLGNVKNLLETPQTTPILLIEFPRAFLHLIAVSFYAFLSTKQSTLVMVQTILAEIRKSIGESLIFGFANLVSGQQILFLPQKALLFIAVELVILVGKIVFGLEPAVPSDMEDRNSSVFENSA